MNVACGIDLPRIILSCFVCIFCFICLFFRSFVRLFICLFLCFFVALCFFCIVKSTFLIMSSPAATFSALNLHLSAARTTPGHTGHFPFTQYLTHCIQTRHQLLPDSMATLGLPEEYKMCLLEHGEMLIKNMSPDLVMIYLRARGWMDDKEKQMISRKKKASSKTFSSWRK